MEAEAGMLGLEYLNLCGGGYASHLQEVLAALLALEPLLDAHQLVLHERVVEIRGVCFVLLIVMCALRTQP